MGQGESIRAARARLRMTQAALAAAAGVGINTVKRAEGGLPVQDETIRSLCAVLGLDAACYPRGVPEAAPEPLPLAGVATAALPPCPTPLDALREWDPSPEVRAVIALGLVGLLAAPFVLTRWAWVGRGAFPTVSTPPEPLAWLDVGALNLAFSGAMLVLFMFAFGRSVAGILVKEITVGTRDEDWPGPESIVIPLSIMSAFLALLPLDGGWSVLQQMAMLAAGPMDLSWMAGLLLVAGNALLAVWLIRKAGPMVLIPPLLPLTLATGFVLLAPAHGQAGTNAVAAGLVLACAASIRHGGPRAEAAP